MIEVLRAQGAGTCANCGGKITRYVGDFGTDGWFHDDSGRQPCPDATFAQPVPVSMVKP